MSHHVFVAKKPVKHHVGFGALVASILVLVIAGWTFTTGRAMLANMAAAQQQLADAVQAAKAVRDQVVPAAPSSAATSRAFDPVIQKMKAQLEQQPTQTQ
jgi:hypothetical protein